MFAIVLPSSSDTQIDHRIHLKPRASSSACRWASSDMNRKNRDFPALRKTDFREGFSLQGDPAKDARSRRGYRAIGGRSAIADGRTPDAGLVGSTDRDRKRRRFAGPPQAK